MSEVRVKMALSPRRVGGWEKVVGIMTYDVSRDGACISAMRGWMFKYESWKVRSQSAASFTIAPRKRFLVQSMAAAPGERGSASVLRRRSVQHARGEDAIGIRSDGATCSTSAEKRGDL